MLKATDEFKQKFGDNFGEWNSNISILYNLEELLDTKLPSRGEQSTQVNFIFSNRLRLHLFDR